MNLLLLRPEDHLSGTRYVVQDARSQHMLEVLKVQVGDEVRAGLLNGPRGHAEVEAISGLRLEVTMRADHELPPRPNIDLLLALPRPRSLKKLLPEVTALGVRSITLVETLRVEKSFFGATFLKPEVHLPLLYEGLMQAKLTFLPEIRVERKLWRVLEQLPQRYPDHLKLVAHPDAPTPLAQVAVAAQRPVLLAVGPEGGFVDAEVQRLGEAGFLTVTMGEKTLRVETACVALLAQIDLLRQQG